MDQSPAVSVQSDVPEPLLPDNQLVMEWTPESDGHDTAGRDEPRPELHRSEQLNQILIDSDDDEPTGLK